MMVTAEEIPRLRIPISLSGSQAQKTIITHQKIGMGAKFRRLMVEDMATLTRMAMFGFPLGEVGTWAIHMGDITGTYN